MLDAKHRIRRMVFLPIFNAFLSRKTRFWGMKRALLRLASITVSNSAKVVGPLIIGNAVALSIGQNVWLGMDFSVYGSGTCIIGDNCDIGPDVSVLSGSHEIGSEERRAGKGMHYTIEIGNGVWIGGRATLYGNINIGDSTIIAAGAVVNRNVPKNLVWGGVPAKEIKRLDRRFHVDVDKPGEEANKRFE